MFGWNLRNDAIKSYKTRNRKENRLYVRLKYANNVIKDRNEIEQLTALKKKIVKLWNDNSMARDEQ